MTHMRYRTEMTRAPTEIPRPGSIPQMIVPRQQMIQTAASILKTDFIKNNHDSLKFQLRIQTDIRQMEYQMKEIKFLISLAWAEGG